MPDPVWSTGVLVLYVSSTLLAKGIRDKKERGLQ